MDTKADYEKKQELIESMRKFGPTLSDPDIRIKFLRATGMYTAKGKLKKVYNGG